MRKLAPLASALFLAACATAPPAPPVETPKPRPQLGQHGLDLRQLDRSVAPCDDFYEYANGGWRRTNPLPATYARYGRFEQVSERNRDVLRNILETSTEPKISGFWAACMNEAAIDAAGTSPIRNDLARIDTISNRRELAAEMARQQQRGVYPVFRFNAQNDYRDSRTVIGAVTQAGLGLPDRDYYLRDDGTYPATRQAYLAHITKMFELAGVANPAADARRVLELETELARAQMRRVDQRSSGRPSSPRSASAE
jgi:predicted metalloendopeptidase